MLFMCDKHVEAPTTVTYEQDSGVLRIECAVCEELLAEIEVASRERALCA